MQANQSNNIENNYQISTSGEKPKYFVEKPYNALFTQLKKKTDLSSPQPDSHDSTTTLIKTSPVKPLPKSSQKTVLRSTAGKPNEMSKRSIFSPPKFKQIVYHEVNNLKQAGQEKTKVAGQEKTKTALWKTIKAGQTKTKKAPWKTKKAGQTKTKKAPSKLTSWINYTV